MATKLNIYDHRVDLKWQLEDRTEEQIKEGRVADGTLDPRGYVVSCHTCYHQWWGTPDNLPLQFDECPSGRNLCPQTIQ